MASSKYPKVLLFDIGGVCVVSPFQAILDYELSHHIPPGWVNNCISKTKPNGFWHRLERGEIPMDAPWFAGFTSDLHSPKLWGEFYATAQRKDPSLPTRVPPLPRIDGESLFWAMMNGAREPDPWMFPALKALKESGRYVLAALSNTVIYPPDHPLAAGHAEVVAMFDVYVSSAHVGLRKPDPRIYQLALELINAHVMKRAREKGVDPQERVVVRPDEIVFLDDIGENLKAAKQLGFGTIKVHLGRAFEAVDELEKLTGLKLAGDHPRIPVLPRSKL